MSASVPRKSRASRDGWSVDWRSLSRSRSHVQVRSIGMKPSVAFIFVSCQVGAEAFLKQEVAASHPTLTFAFSRPGFVTFKCDPESKFDMEQSLHSTFARTWGASLGSVRFGDDGVQTILRQLPELRFKHLHVWRRDSDVPGERHFEPFQVPESLELGNRLKTFAAESPVSGAQVNRVARVGDFIADVVVVEPDQWFFGWHRAASVASRWPGGVPPLNVPEEMISRAYLKLEEALRWSQLPIREGDQCAELGSSPGGSCQALLDHGCRVMGIDPAVMDERLMQRPEFTHLRARAADLKRKQFAHVKWLFADANIAPSNVLDSIEAIVTHRLVNIRGLLLTLKLLDASMVECIPDYVQRIRSWGYGFVRTRQLAFNRREFCVMAVPSKSHLRRRWRR